MGEQGRLFPREPKYPDMPRWSIISGYVALGIYLLLEGVLDMDRIPAFILVSPLVIAFCIGLLLWNRDMKQYKIDSIRGRIESGRGLIDQYKRELEEGQPAYVDMPRHEWEFDCRYVIRKTEEEVEGLEKELTRLTRESKSDAS